ncbi:MAG: hypothetical protein ACI4JN_06675 [Ruminococcus sp.]
MVSQLYAEGAQENDIAEYVKFNAANFCSSITLMDNMPADSDGQVEYITDMILGYIKYINNYCHEEIRYSDKLAECAGIIHAIEEGTANQRQINQAFNSAYNFVDADDTGIDRVRNTDDFRKNIGGNYHELVEQVKTENPDVDEAYIPFMVADVLKEAYEREVN